MRILGIDVAKSSIVCCLLTGKPADIREVYRNSDYFYKFKANSQGIKSLLALFPDCAILEPTGTNYSRLWQTRLEQAGIKVYLVGHGESSNFRKSLGLPDKDDEADALALALYYLQHGHTPRRFLAIREPGISSLREKVFDLEHYARLRNATINRLKQKLAWQFPEVAEYSVAKKFLGDAPLMWRWLAGLSPSKTYDRKYQNSTGEGVKKRTRDAAKVLCQIYEYEKDIENELLEDLSDAKFALYLEVFEEFGFGKKFQALLLSEIYPLEKFFGLNGSPEVVVSRGKISGKPTKKNLSKRRFKKALGAAPIRDWSGERKSYKKTGPSLIKAKFYLWILTKIASRKTRIKNDIGKKLGKLLDELREQKQPTRKAWAKVKCVAVEILYHRLIEKMKKK